MDKQRVAKQLIALAQTFVGDYVLVLNGKVYQRFKNENEVKAMMRKLDILGKSADETLFGSWDVLPPNSDRGTFTKRRDLKRMKETNLLKFKKDIEKDVARRIKEMENEPEEDLFGFGFKAREATIENKRVAKELVAVAELLAAGFDRSKMVRVVNKALKEAKPLLAGLAPSSSRALRFLEDAQKNFKKSKKSVGDATAIYTNLIEIGKEDAKLKKLGETIKNTIADMMD